MDGRQAANGLRRDLCHTTFTNFDTAFIETVPFFFLMTADTETVDYPFKG